MYRAFGCFRLKELFPPAPLNHIRSDLPTEDRYGFIHKLMEMLFAIGDWFYRNIKK
jgi:hypothetical protein